METFVQQDSESKRLVMENRGLRDLVKSLNRAMAERSEEIGKLKGELSHSFMVNGQDELIRSARGLIDSLPSMCSPYPPSVVEALMDLDIAIAKIEAVK
jgi:hypothetical protein